MRAWQKISYFAGIIAMCWISTPGCRLATPDFKRASTNSASIKLFPHPEANRLLRAAPGLSVPLAWDASITPNVTYSIHWGGSSGNYTNKSDVGEAFEYRITGLEPGATYYVAATATDTNGLESDFSNEVAYTVPAASSGTVTITLVMRPTASDPWEVVMVNQFPVTNSLMQFNHFITYEE